MNERQDRRAGWLAGGSVIGAVLASSCCLLPLALFSLGIGGAWIGNLTALEPYRPFFIGATVLLLAAGFRATRRPPVCAADGYCATPRAARLLRVALWGATALVVLALLWPWLAPYLLN